MALSSSVPRGCLARCNCSHPTVQRTKKTTMLQSAPSTQRLQGPAATCPLVARGPDAEAGPDTQGEELSQHLPSVFLSRQRSRREGGKQIHTTAAVSTSYFETRCRNNRLRGRDALGSRAKAGCQLAERRQRCSCGEILHFHHLNGSSLLDSGSNLFLSFFFFFKFSYIHSLFHSLREPLEMPYGNHKGLKGVCFEMCPFLPQFPVLKSLPQYL